VVFDPTQSAARRTRTRPSVVGHSYRHRGSQTGRRSTAESELAKRTADLADLAVASERLRSEQVKRAGAEEAARAGEERFRAVADSLPEPLTDIAPDQRYRFTDVAFEEWFGLTSQRAKSFSVREVMGEEIYSSIQPPLRRRCGARGPALRGTSFSRRPGDDMSILILCPAETKAAKIMASIPSLGI
jgi:PAS domain-containing protein